MGSRPNRAPMGRRTWVFSCDDRTGYGVLGGRILADTKRCCPRRSACRGPKHGSAFNRDGTARRGCS